MTNQIISSRKWAHIHVHVWSGNTVLPPYRGKFSQVKIFTDFADQLLSVKNFTHKKFTACAQRTTCMLSGYSQQFYTAKIYSHQIRKKIYPTEFPTIWGYLPTQQKIIEVIYKTTLLLLQAFTENGTYCTILKPLG